MYDADPSELIEKAAEELKKDANIKPPQWAPFIKTGMSKERPPARSDWWHMRAASVLRTVYRLGPIGVSKLRTKYGGRKNRGVKPENFAKASGKIIRTMLQQAEKAGLVEKIDKSQHGRRLTVRGREFLDNIAKEINKNAPDSVSFLCPSCKKHFKEVLEYLEEMNIQYNLNKSLVRGLSYYTRTVFEVYTENEEDDGPPVQIASGGRYDYLAKKIGGKKDVPAVGFSMGVDRIVEAKWYRKLSPRILKKPKVYFIQLGPEAKLKSLNIIEILRKAHIPMAQSLSKDSLGSQLAVAEKLQVPYTLIFGVKEALDNSVIIRDMSNRSQENVKLDKLLEYLKENK